MKSLIVVDPHVHFWNTRCLRYPWLDQRGEVFSGDNRLLPDPFEVPDLLRVAGDVEVQKSVHVEANPADPIAEARWLQSLAEEPAHGGHPHGIVAFADLLGGRRAGHARTTGEYPNLRGIRQILNTHADRRFSYVETDYLRDPRWRSNVRRLTEHGCLFDLQIYPYAATRRSRSSN